MPELVQINRVSNFVQYSMISRHEDGRRSRSEESDDESDTGEKEERETKDKVEGCVQEGHADCRTERGRCRRQGLLERDDQQP